ncbi:MFS transporter [Streptomyces purpureus]|uniref:MFS transporter n=1 Tax=Streptomyces purpureus TaxID=1951 RepID=UPI0003647081|nr:MFS transporter [Streptomyces purpureus]
MTVAQAEAGVGVRGGWLLGVVLGGAFLAVCDAFVVNVALPSLRADLGASFAQAQWAVSGYVLVYGLGLVMGGRLGDAYGRRRLFAVGVALFTAASLGCALAWGPGVLAVFRLVQAAGAALFYPQVLAVLQSEFTGRARARAFAWFGAVIGVASVAGQLLGGLLVDADVWGLSWRAVFWINIPLGAALVAGALATIPRNAARRRAGVDVAGTVAGMAALGLASVALTFGPQAGWAWWIWLMLALGVGLGVVFVRHESRLTSRGGCAVVDPALLRGVFGRGCALALAFFAGNAALFFVLTLYLQDQLAMSPAAAGLVFTPLALAFTAASLLAPQATTRFTTSQVLACGYALNLAGTLALGALVLAGPHTTAAWWTAGPLTVIGLGQGLGVSPLFAHVLAGVRERDTGAASGILETATQLGMSLGVTAVGLVLTATLPTPTPTPADGAGGVAAFAAAAGLCAALALLALLLARRLTHPQPTPTTPTAPGTGETQAPAPAPAPGAGVVSVTAGRP